MRLRLLYAASEVYPFAKTGGLADVAAGLPKALAARGAEVRVAVPGYRGWRRHGTGCRKVTAATVLGQAFTVWEVPATPGLAFWLIDCPVLFDRPGSPYQDDAGRVWDDNSWRFGCFSQLLAQLSVNGEATGFIPDVVHANDWHTGLIMPWLQHCGSRARRVYTIHNLAYQGVYPHQQALDLQLPPSWWHMEGVEFYGQLSHMKAGIAYADAVTTVSPGYAREIQTAEQGCGLDGLLRARASRLHGIVNGIDDHGWDPATDPAIACRYQLPSVGSGKAANKWALQKEMGLDIDAAPALIGIVSRLAHQKGIDLVAEAARAMSRLPVQFAILGDGDTQLRRELQQLAAAYPGRVALRLGHDEACARRIVAGADIFLMCSRYEPCGLTQMFSQRYGTVPVVHKTGGLADTVVDATDSAMADGSASGVHFLHADVGGVLLGLMRALELRGNSARWLALQRAGMSRDFSWSNAAVAYENLYATLLSGQQ